LAFNKTIRHSGAARSAEPGAHFDLVEKQNGLQSPSLDFALRAIGHADVRSGVLPGQSRLRGNDDKKDWSGLS
jgi:hypothetical protein